ncbi:FBD domain [Macleaya cordata]|uniref:FBD domain n=1 Tax=Macleaya cordata TaxID=56857 RepID=A0A200R1N3_MACCD|nr:FBD domain [Macleaya cordata]
MQHRQHGEKIDSLAIHFYLDSQSTPHLNDWITTAISKQVEEIELNLSDINHPDLHRNYELLLESQRYQFRYGLIMMNQGRKSTVKRLHLESCTFKSAIRFDGSSSLINVDLKRVKISDEQLKNVLDTCSCLEWFSLDRCQDLINLDVTAGAMQDLKYLNVNCCLRLESVEIRNLNLAEFEYSGPHVKLILKEVPRLAKFSLSVISGDIKGSITEALTKLPAKLPALETFNLLLNLDMKTLILPEDAPTFTNVKQLILTIVPLKDDDDFAWMTYLLKAFPLLQKLQLNLFSSSSFSTKEVRPIPECGHEHLKEVEINGFRGNQNEIELIQYLSRNMVGLKAEDLVFNWECKRYRGFNNWEVDEHISSFDRRLWNQIKTSLQRRLKMMNIYKPCQPYSIDVM